jgi:hypothetical protein
MKCTPARVAAPPSLLFAPFPYSTLLSECIILCISLSLVDMSWEALHSYFVEETWSTSVLYNDGGLVLDATMRIASLVKMYESPDQIVVPATMYLYASVSAKYCLIREDHILEASEREGQVVGDHGRDGG